MIEVSNLCKSFGDLKALDNVNVTVNDGSIYGLVGENGSGKTTFLKTLAGILTGDCGSIRLDGEQIYENPAVKERMFLIPDELFFFGNYNLREMGRLYSQFYPKWDQMQFDNMKEAFNIEDSRPLGRFSKGMQKQAIFAVAMACMPDVLMLDEPVDGLDPIARRIVWKCIVEQVAQRNLSVIISSHNLKEIEGICDTVGILASGRMEIERELDDLKSEVHKIQVVVDDDKQKDFYDGLNILNIKSVGSVDMAIVKNSMAEIEEKVEHCRPKVLDVLPLTLEEIFIYEMGGEDDDYSEYI